MTRTRSFPPFKVLVLFGLLLILSGCPGPTAGSPWSDPTASRAWTIVGSPGISNGSYTTSVAFEPGGNAFVAMQEYNGGANTARVMWSPGGTGGWMDLGVPNISVITADYLKLAVSHGSTCYVAYVDPPTASVIVQMFNGSAWAPLGPAVGSVSLSTFQPFALAFDNSDNLYVAYADATNGGKATVRKWNGSAWPIVGTPAGFSPGAVDFVGMGIDAGNRIYAAYQDLAFGNEGSASLWDPTTATWSQLGPQGFTGTSVWDMSLSMDPYGLPYVAYHDAGVGGKASAMRYTGTAWVYAGNRGFTAGQAGGTSIVIDRWGTPYVAYVDYTLGSPAVGYPISAMVLRGNTWIPFGTAGFSPGSANYVSLAVDSDGKVAAAFEDAAHGSATTVMTFQ